VEEWARCLVEVAARMAAESSCTLSAQGFHSAVGAVGWRDARSSDGCFAYIRFVRIPVGDRTAPIW